MKKLLIALVGVAVLGIALSFIGSSTISAKRAYAEKGTGCFVLDPNGIYNGYAVDANCQTHDVTKEDDEGYLELFFYQDHGQTSWHPEETYRSTYEGCVIVQPYGQVCGIIKESVTPSGEYKSSFKSF